jgi:hypothetical protein
MLLLPLLAACGNDEPVTLPPGPMGFRHLTPLPLNVAAVEVAEGGPVPMLGDIGRRLSPSPAEAVRIMGRDRLFAVGTAGQARFTVAQASLVQGRDSLTCLVGCRLEILDAGGSRLGFVEAQSRRAITGREAGRPRADEALLRQAMDDLNVEFEFQLRRTLREWLVRVTPGAEGTGPDGTAPAGGVTREDLSPT